jgi:hypothetical protein
MNSHTPSIKVLSKKILFKDAHSYLAHPFCAQIDADRWILVFNQTVRREVILHPPEDPRYYNMISISNDEGQTWSTPLVSPNFDWHGVECASITVLKSGRLLLNQWQFDWLTIEKARTEANRDDLVYPSIWGADLHANAELPTNHLIPKNPENLFPWVRGNGGTYVHISDDSGNTWNKTVTIDTAPFSGGYGMRGGVQIKGGKILLPLCDVPQYEKVFIVTSIDEGLTWSAPSLIAEIAGLKFEEPAIIALESGELLVLLRENTNRKMYQLRSLDDGLTWSTPEPTGIDGYPAHLLQLPSGEILCTYGYRNDPYGIRIVISNDLGHRWNNTEFLTVVDGLPNRNLGYPVTLMRKDGKFNTIYYSQNLDGTTSINSAIFQLNLHGEDE